MTDDVKALIAEAEEIHSDDAYGAFTMMHRLADALEAAHAEPDDDERGVPIQIHERLTAAVRGMPVSQLRRVPVSRDELAENLRRIHFDGTGCGTTASTACSNCFGPSPMTAREIAEHLSATHDIYPKADRKPADVTPDA